MFASASLQRAVKSKQQVLYKIDSSSLQTSVRDAEATLSSAKVALASAKAKAKAVSYRELVDIEAVSQESAEEADYKQAIATVESAEANLEAAKLSLSYAHVTSPINGLQ